MKPCIVLVGLDSIFIDEVLHGLTGTNCKSDENHIDWTIDTKYYTADVQLCPLTSKMLVEESIANATEMLIILLDPSHMNSRTKLDSWLPFLSVLNDCQTKLIVARQMTELSNTMSRSELEQWCTKHQYEFLELEKRATSETDETEEDEDDDGQLYPDVYGIPRLIQTLHVHQWSNMDLKDRREINRNLAAQLKAKLHFDDGHDVNDREKKKEDDENGEEQQQEKKTKNTEPIDRSETTTTTTLNHQDELDEFGMENIFEQMRRYKEEADRLQGDERKDFAEKVILSLWKKMGMDDDEDDLEEEEEEETAED